MQLVARVGVNEYIHIAIIGRSVARTGQRSNGAVAVVRHLLGIADGICTHVVERVTGCGEAVTAVIGESEAVTVVGVVPFPLQGTDVTVVAGCALPRLIVKILLEKRGVVAVGLGGVDTGGPAVQVIRVTCADMLVVLSCGGELSQGIVSELPDTGRRVTIAQGLRKEFARGNLVV